MAATLLDGNALLETVKDDLRARIKALGEQGITPGPRHDPRRRRSAEPRVRAAEARGLRRDRRALDPHRAARRRHPAELHLGHRAVQRRSRRRRVHPPGPAARPPRRRGRAPRHRPRQGRRRPAPGQPGQARHGRARRAPAVHAARHPGAARDVQRADRGPARRDHRARAHDRPAAREPPLAEGAARQRDRHRVPHRHALPAAVHEGSRHHRRGRGPPVDPHPRHGPPRRGRRRRGRDDGGPPGRPRRRRGVRGGGGLDHARAWAASGPTTRAMLLRQTVETAERRAGDAEGPDDGGPAGHAALRGVRRPGRRRRGPVPVVRVVAPRGARREGSRPPGVVGDRRGVARGVRGRAADRRRGQTDAAGRAACDAEFVRRGASGPKIRAEGCPCCWPS